MNGKISPVKAFPYKGGAWIVWGSVRWPHVINLFTWPSSQAGEFTFARYGFDSLKRTKAGMTYWAISDLNLKELEQFADLHFR